MASSRGQESSIKGHTSEAQTIFANDLIMATDKQRKQDFVTKIKPMLSTHVDKPFDNKDWVFEVKWDGVRSILFLHKKKALLEL